MRRVLPPHRPKNGLTLALATCTNTYSASLQPALETTHVFAGREVRMDQLSHPVAPRLAATKQRADQKGDNRFHSA